MVYLDTSALAKRYLNEARSEAFESYFIDRGGGVISAVTITEMRSLLARRRRDGSIDDPSEERVAAAFDSDLSSGILLLHPLTDDTALEAARIIKRLPDLPLRALDALHLASAIGAGVEELATADRRMAEAALALGLRVESFWG